MRYRIVTSIVLVIALLLAIVFKSDSTSTDGSSLIIPSQQPHDNSSSKNFNL